MWGLLRKIGTAGRGRKGGVDFEKRGLGTLCRALLADHCGPAARPGTMLGTCVEWGYCVAVLGEQSLKKEEFRRTSQPNRGGGVLKLLAVH